MPPMWRLGVIATAAGAVSGLFGVGGGGGMVPLRVRWVGSGAREAAGTSLAAMPIIATLGAIAQGFNGNVAVARGLLMGIPAIGGVLAGTWLQQPVPPVAVSVLLGIVLVTSAVML